MLSESVVTIYTFQIRRYTGAACLLMCAALYGILCIAAPLFAAETLSDDEKQRRVMAMYADYRRDFPGIEEIGAAAAIALLDNPEIVFLDVREPREQAVSIIPEAITEDQLLDNLDRYRRKRIIAYCTISYRSGKLAAKLNRQGVTITNLKGGLLAWTHAGGPLVRGDQPVRQMHVYGRKWDLAPAAIETTY